jgi:hypothetical protein
MRYHNPGPARYPGDGDELPERYEITMAMRHSILLCNQTACIHTPATRWHHLRASPHPHALLGPHEQVMDSDIPSWTLSCISSFAIPRLTHYPLTVPSDISPQTIPRVALLHSAFAWTLPCISSSATLCLSHHLPLRRHLTSLSGQFRELLCYILSLLACHPLCSFHTCYCCYWVYCFILHP